MLSHSPTIFALMVVALKLPQFPFLISPSLSHLMAPITVLGPFVPHLDCTAMTRERLEGDGIGSSSRHIASTSAYLSRRSSRMASMTLICSRRLS